MHSDLYDDWGFFDPAQLPDCNKKPLDELALWILIFQLSLALAYLHHGLSFTGDLDQLLWKFEEQWYSVIHRDIKPANSERS